MSNVEKALGGDFSVELSAAEFKEVNLKLVKAIATFTGDAQLSAIRDLYKLGVTVDLQDSEKVWHSIRAVQVMFADVPGIKDAAYRVVTAGFAWMEYYKEHITNFNHQVDPVPFYNVPSEEIPFDWQSA